ncbi:MAG: BRO family protein [Rivularia sp. (in: cyanobacteria)]
MNILTFENQPVRIIETNGLFWWVVVDLCRVLGLTNPSMAVCGQIRTNKSGKEYRSGGIDVEDVGMLYLYDSGELKIEPIDEGGLMHLTTTADGGLSSAYASGNTEVKKMLVVNEAGFYNLIFKSRKPAAKRLKRWTFSEVLPSIRKTGSYSVEQKEVNPAFKQEREGMAAINQQLQQIHSELEEFRKERNITKQPAFLPKSTKKPEDIPNGYIETEDGWISPSQYEYLRNGGSRRIHYEARIAAKQIREL